MEINGTAILQVGGHRANSRSRVKYALVSIEDYSRKEIAGVKWSIHSAGYAYRIKTVKGKKEMIYLHREVLGLGPGQGIVDHINGNRLDCRIENLRVLSSNADNLQNRKSRVFGSSRYRGVTFNQKAKSWVAQVGYDGQMFYGGSYKDETKAAIAAEAIRRRYMPYAFPDEELQAQFGSRLDEVVKEKALQMGF